MALCMWSYQASVTKSCIYVSNVVPVIIFIINTVRVTDLISSFSLKSHRAVQLMQVPSWLSVFSTRANSTSPVPALSVCGLMVKWVVSLLAFGIFSESGTPQCYLGGTKHHSCKSEALHFWPTCSLCRTCSTSPVSVSCPLSCQWVA